jgi:hypothetical protein
MLQVIGQVPRQFALRADHAVARDCRDENQARRRFRDKRHIRPQPVAKL